MATNRNFRTCPTTGLLFHEPAEKLMRWNAVVGVVCLLIGGLLAIGVVAWLWLHGLGPQYGWGWTMSGILIFSGTQLVMLGLIGEYLGRMFIAVNQRPQSVVREVLASGGPA